MPVQLIKAAGLKMGAAWDEVGGNASKAGRSFSESRADREGSVVLNACPPDERKRFQR
jgi:hypothetical protein